jgi:aryl-alcohol dehydrogenase-like predicted oxidoreductase
MPPIRRPLGSSGLRVAPVALGGNVFGWTIDEARSFEILHAFVDAGFNLIDTADVYSIWAPGHRGGESESILGRWLRESGRRKDVVIATKVGMDMGPAGAGLAPEHIRVSIEGSLQRLGTAEVDLYQAHEDDPKTPLEQTLEAFAELVSDGKVRALGASNYEADRLRAALEISRERDWPRFESFQPRYNLLDRADYEGPIEEVCRAAGLGVITYSSLASGFLTGKYRSVGDQEKSARGPRVVKRLLNDRGLRVLAAVDEVAARLGVPRSTVALAWILHRPSVTAPIASATSLEQLEELLAAPSLRLSADDLLRLEEASVPVAA